MGWMAYPLAFVALKHLPDKGYAFSKVLALLLVGYFSWILGYVSFGGGTIFAALLLVAALSALLLLTWTGKPFFEFAKANAGFFLLIELFFFAAFFVAGAYKSRTPEIAGTEKPMDFAMINGILSSPSMPPQDPWLSGGSISYYYFGYLIVADLCKLTSTPSGEGYNLAVALTWALAAVCAFSIAYALTRRYRYSLLSAACVAVFGNQDYWHRAIQSFTIGNLNAPYYNQPVDPNADKGFSGFFGFLFSPLQHGWDYFQASRIVPVPPSDKLINEFPSFSFFLSDLHPHVMAIPFVLLAVAVAYNQLKSPLPGLGVFSGPRYWQWAQWGLVALLYGALSFFNSWDFPTFLLLFGLCLFLQQWWADGNDFKTWLKPVALVGIPIVLGAFALYLPFYLRFQSQAKGLGLVKDRTDLYYLLVIFGLFFTLEIPLMVGKALGLKEKGPDKAAKTKGKRVAEEGHCAVCGKEGSGKKFCGFCGGELMPPGSSEAPAFTLKNSDRMVLDVLVFFYLLPLMTVLIQQMANWLGTKMPAFGAFLADSARLVSGVEFLLAFACTVLLVWGGNLAVLVFREQFSKSGRGAMAGWGVGLLAVLTLLLNFAQLSTVFLALVFLIVLWKSFYGKADNKETLFVRMLLFIGFMLVGGCEMVFLKDFFSDGALYRMNTVFKFHYQVWILFGVAAGPCLKWLMENRWPQWAAWKKAVWGVLAAGVLLGSGLYPVMALTSRIKNSSPDNATMDGEVYYDHTFGPDYQAAQWIRQNVKPAGGKVPVILQAWGGSYQQQFGVIATVTGYPTVLGWDFHEAQWRGSWDQAVIRGGDPADTLFRRRSDIDSIYTSPDLNLTRDLLKRYSVDYVYVGDQERGKYKDHPENLGKFAQLGTVVQQFGNSFLYKVNP